MAYSNTYAFSPSLADLIVHAYGRCQIRRPALTTDHLRDAAFAANLLQVDWQNERGVNLWTVDLETTALIDGTTNYAVDATTVGILAAWITQSGSDTLLTSISRNDYAAIPNKTTEGKPTQYWFDLQTSPTITLWPVPNATATYTLKYYRARQVQDATVPGALQPEVPYRFLEAYTAALAERLAELYAPAELPRLMMRSAAAWKKASERDVEDAPLNIAPQLGSYYGMS